MQIYKNREAAGQLLALRLSNYANKENTLVLGIPRGGVVVAYQIAKKLNIPLDIVITRKIGAPTQPELALGALDPRGEVFWDQNLLMELGIKKDQLVDEIEAQKKEIQRRETLYRKDRLPLDITGKVVILVDDGIATGATVQAAINYLKYLKAGRIILAIPVLSKEVLNILDSNIDEMIILQLVEYLGAVGSFYEDFHPISDEEVIALMASS
ncbi:phosphoribosyltransferase [Candidatus Daviesbacteria bacterium]|nr:phosphoribosyltransferase [Candidatus Daviesbacteria bacterium]